MHGDHINFVTHPCEITISHAVSCARMQLTVVDLAEMSFEPATLCQYGVGNLGDAELILATVRKLHGMYNNYLF